MNKVVLKRILILFISITLLLGLELVSAETLLINLPSEIDVINAYIQEQEQLSKIEQLRDAYYNEQADLVDEFETEIELAEQRLLLDQQRLEEERLKEVENLIKNTYTLGDRDKPQDYQNLFTDSIKHTFIIDFDTLEWYGLVNDMLEYKEEFDTYKSNNYRKVDVTYYADDEKIFIPDVGIRSKGNIFSRYPPIDENGNVIPIHYVLKFNETFDYQYGSQEYDWLKGREVFDLEKLIFKWNKQDDPTYINELFSYRMFKEAGVPIAEISLTEFIIRVDGEEVMKELYTVQESMDEEFIRKQLQDTPSVSVGDLYKVTWSGTLEPIYDMNLVGIRDWENNIRPVYGKETNDNIENFNNLINFTRDLDTLTDTELIDYFDNYFDVDSFIWSLAVNVLVGNPDDYRGNANNYYLYFDESDYLTFIPFDYDNSMGEGWDGSTVFIDYTIGNDIYIWEGDGFSEWTKNVVLVERVLEITEYKILYENYLEAMIDDGYFTYLYYSDLFDTFESIYGDDFDMFNNKYPYISQKTTEVLEDIDYYRNERN